MNRPPLPTRSANPHIQEALASGTLPPVKYQILNCQGQDILVGRLKIETPTPSGHAFILRRFDTGAVSLTTMFRAAFPNAAEEEEKQEIAWVKEHYNLAGNNGSTKDSSITRLAGTWVDPKLALELGESYSLGSLIVAMCSASPDPGATYRRSGKSSASAPAPASAASPAAQAAARSLPTPSPSSPNPAKRRKESPGPAPAAAPVSSPVSVSKPPLPRRSTRTKSPGPKTAPIPSLSSAVKSTKKAPATRKTDIATPTASDETAVEEETQAADHVVGSELRDQDIAEQKEMIADLKAKRALSSKPPSKAAESAPKLKRVRNDEEDKLELNIREPEVGERIIATNRRITPSRKAAAWGVLVFAFGLTATAFLPSLF